MTAVASSVPGWLPALLRDTFGVDVPSHDEVELAPSSLTQVALAVPPADLVLVLRGLAPAHAPVMGIVVEIPRSCDERVRVSWPLHLAALHARLGCLTCLVVVAPDDDVARWAREPIGDLHPGMILRPFVLDPTQLPRVDRAVAMQKPGLAVLSALVHGNRLGGVTLAYAAVLALRKPYDKGREEGRLSEVRHMLRAIATRRLGELGEVQRAWIEACANRASLERMLVEVAVAPDAATVARVLAAG